MVMCMARMGIIIKKMTLSHYHFREGNIKDLAQVKKLGLFSFSQYFNELTEENKNILEKALNDEQKTINLLTHSKSFVCEYEQQIVGMAFLVPSGNAFDVFEKEWAVIRMVSVNPMHGGKGIAKSLTQNCIAFAKQTNEKTIALHTSEMMHAARHIYENLGFKILKEIEPRFGKRYWLYLLNL